MLGHVVWKNPDSGEKLSPRGKIMLGTDHVVQMGKRGLEFYKDSNLLVVAEKYHSSLLVLMHGIVIIFNFLFSFHFACFGKSIA